MSLTSDLKSFMTLHPGVAAIIADRFHPKALPATATLPAATYQAISGPRDHSHDGPGLAYPRYQITCYAVTYIAAHDLADVVKGALDGWRAAYGFPAFAGDPYDVPSEPDTGVYAAAVDVDIWHR